MVSIQKEGLPTDPIALKNIYTRFHESFNISSSTVAKDLSTYASHIGSKRLSYLQKTRSNYNNYFRP